MKDPPKFTQIWILVQKYTIWQPCSELSCAVLLRSSRNVPDILLSLQNILNFYSNIFIFYSLSLPHFFILLPLQNTVFKDYVEQKKTFLLFMNPNAYLVCKNVSFWWV
jgi:hypothetical protein